MGLIQKVGFGQDRLRWPISARNTKLQRRGQTAGTKPRTVIFSLGGRNLYRPSANETRIPGTQSPIENDVLDLQERRTDFGLARERH